MLSSLRIPVLLVIAIIIHSSVSVDGKIIKSFTKFKTTKGLQKPQAMKQTLNPIETNKSFNGIKAGKVAKALVKTLKMVIAKRNSRSVRFGNPWSQNLIETNKDKASKKTTTKQVSKNLKSTTGMKAAKKIKNPKFQAANKLEMVIAKRRNSRSVRFGNPWSQNLIETNKDKASKKTTTKQWVQSTSGIKSAKKIKNSKSQAAKKLKSAGVKKAKSSDSAA